MKRVVIYTLILSNSFIYSQTSGIGVQTSHPKGILDLSTADGSNSTMGLVLPRADSVDVVTYVKDNHIAHGTVIYDLKNDCPRVYMHHLQSWSECLGGKNILLSTSEIANENECFVYNKIIYCVLMTSKGKLWLDKDLELFSYYQWGRGNDGHQKSSSLVTNLAQKPIPFTGVPVSGFIINYGTYKNWVNPTFTDYLSLWDPNTSSNNPCPAGWKVPLESDFSSLLPQDINKLFGLTKKDKGIRQGDREGTFTNSGYFLWTNTIDSAQDMSKAVKVLNGSVNFFAQRRDNGLRIRCVKK